MRDTRKTLERLYRDKVTITVFGTVKRAGATEDVETVLVTDEPCKVSLRIQRVPNQGTYAASEYDAKIFIRPDLIVPDNAEYHVTNMHGQTAKYVGGKPFSYSGHQEIYLRYKEKV